jgi:SAM-dependent methyltransferase
MVGSAGRPGGPPSGAAGGVTDHYRGAGPRWATGATLVYGPIADQLVARSPHPLRGRLVLDAGAGTGAASAALLTSRARPVAVDLSADMLRYNTAAGGARIVGDICALPLSDAAVHDAVAAFVLNHLVDPGPAFRELVRVVRSGGVVLACVYANSSRSAVRDLVDEVARAAGWQAPGWYVEAKAHATPVLGTAAAMAAAAGDAGLSEITVEERPVDVGVTEPSQLVAYRFGQAPFTAWLESIGPVEGEAVRRAAVQAVLPVMEPYRPIVVFLTATRP